MFVVIIDLTTNQPILTKIINIFLRASEKFKKNFKQR